MPPSLDREQGPTWQVRGQGLGCRCDLPAEQNPGKGLPTLIIFFNTAGVADCLRFGVSPRFRGVLGGKFSSNSSGLRRPPNDTRRRLPGSSTVHSERRVWRKSRTDATSEATLCLWGPRKALQTGKGRRPGQASRS